MNRRANNHLNLTDDELDTLATVLDNIIETEHCLSVAEQIGQYDANGDVQETTAETDVHRLRIKVAYLRDEPLDPTVLEAWGFEAITIA